jgi:DnaJ family protein C protein 17
MAPLLSEEESALDPYLILELEITATEKDIQRAYRKRSLLYHPDKNHGKSEAELVVLAKKFAELGLAQGILNDPAKRTYVDTRLETDRRRKEKYAQSDKKRKDMIDVRRVLPHVMANGSDR